MQRILQSSASTLKTLRFALDANNSLPRQKLRGSLARSLVEDPSAAGHVYAKPGLRLVGSLYIYAGWGLLYLVSLSPVLSLSPVGFFAVTSARLFVCAARRILSRASWLARSLDFMRFFLLLPSLSFCTSRRWGGALTGNYLCFGDCVIY